MKFLYGVMVSPIKAVKTLWLLMILGMISTCQNITVSKANDVSLSGVIMVFERFSSFLIFYTMNNYITNWLCFLFSLYFCLTNGLIKCYLSKTLMSSVFQSSSRLVLLKLPYRNTDRAVGFPELEQRKTQRSPRIKATKGQNGRSWK